MIKNKEYTIFVQFAFDSICVNTSVDCVWLYAYVNGSISPVSICPHTHKSVSVLITWLLNFCLVESYNKKLSYR